jgi:opacity protein-like surface antigen
MTQLKRISIAVFALNAMLICGLFAQQYNVPLTMEGFNHTDNGSIISKAMGGVTIPIQQDVALMFTNPASMSTLNAMTVSVSGNLTFTNASQEQQWYPLVYYGNFSLLMDGTVRGIDTSGVPHSYPTHPYGPGDTLQYPYDDIWPNWSRTKDANKYIPEIFFAAPLKIGKLNATVGAGLTKYANMDYYYRNNNTLSQDYDLQTTPQTAAKDSVRNNWSQAIHQRDGNIYGYGGAFSLAISEKLSAGISARYIQGRTDDFEQTIGRGVLWFYGSLYVQSAQSRWHAALGNIFIVDSVSYQRTLQGTSDFSGFEYNISAQYRTKNVTIGFSVTPPSTITRKFSGSLLADTGATIDYAASHRAVDTSFTEKTNLPWKGKLGIGFQVTPNFLAAIEYEYCPYSQAEFEKDGVISHPWLDASAIHFGINWEPTNSLFLRFGYRKQNETFTPKNSPFPDQPVSYNTYSAGLGVQLIPNLVLNVAYEFYEMKYEDVWAQSYHINTLTSNSISAELTYSLK